MNIKDAVARACEFNELSEALASIALWETNRIIEQAVKHTANNTRNLDESLYDSCFKFCFEKVLEEHPKIQQKKKDVILKDKLSSVDFIDGIFRFSKQYFVAIKEFNVAENMQNILLDIEDQLDVGISVRAHQGRNIDDMFNGAVKIWTRF